MNGISSATGAPNAHLTLQATQTTASSAIGNANTQSLGNTSNSESKGDCFETSSSFSIQANQDMTNMLTTMLMLDVLFGDDDEKKKEDSNLLLMLAMAGGFDANQFSQVATGSSSYNASGQSVALTQQTTGSAVNVMA